jgi:hypothetical protein
MYLRQSIQNITRRLIQNENKWIMKKSKAEMDIIRKIYEKQNPFNKKYDSNIIISMETEKLLTEDLGKIFEMAICLTYNTPFIGPYKYSMEEAMYIKENLLHKLPTIFPYKLKHIASKGNKYDFGSDDGQIYLSAKTTKKDGKVCPQVIGQPTKKKFCEFFNIELDYSLEQIKQYIQTNPLSLLNEYLLNTFDCPVLYYNKRKKMILLIKLKEKINWINYEIFFSHTLKNKVWNESSTIQITMNGRKVSIGEFQVHNNRDCIKFRWCFEKLLNLFKDNFDIISLNNFE